MPYARRQVGWRVGAVRSCVGHAASSTPGELFRNLVHQRVGQLVIAKIREIAQYKLLPRRVVFHILLTAVLQIDRSRFVGTPEEHQGVGPLGIDPDLAGAGLDSFFGRTLS